MSRFGLEYNPYGRDRDRFESQEDFARRCEEDKENKKSVEDAERKRREEEQWEHD